MARFCEAGYRIKVTTYTRVLDALAPAKRMIPPQGNMNMGLGMGWKAREMVRVTCSLVSVVDDDESVRESLPDLLREFGFAVRTFSSAQEFLASDCIKQTTCLLLDVRMPGMSGPVLQQELRRLKREIPIVFITAPADETLRSNLIEQGAAACLFKPFSDTALYEALDAAVGMN